MALVRGRGREGEDPLRTDGAGCFRPNGIGARLHGPVSASNVCNCCRSALGGRAHHLYGSGAHHPVLPSSNRFGCRPSAAWCPTPWRTHMTATAALTSRIPRLTTGLGPRRCGCARTPEPGEWLREHSCMQHRTHAHVEVIGHNLGRALSCPCLCCAALNPRPVARAPVAGAGLCGGLGPW